MSGCRIRRLALRSIVREGVLKRLRVPIRLMVSPVQNVVSSQSQNGVKDERKSEPSSIGVSTQSSQSQTVYSLVPSVILTRSSCDIPRCISRNA